MAFLLLAPSLCGTGSLSASTQAPGVQQQNRLLTELQRRQEQKGAPSTGGPATAPSVVVDRTVISKDLEVLRAYAKQKKPGKAEGFKGLLPFEARKAQATLARLRQEESLLTADEKAEVDAYQGQLGGGQRQSPLPHLPLKLSSLLSCQRPAPCRPHQRLSHLRSCLDQCWGFQARALYRQHPRHKWHQSCQ